MSNQQLTNQLSKKQLILFFVGFLVLIIVFLFYKYKQPKENILTPTSTTPKLEEKIIHLSSKELPPYLPKDIVSEENINVLESYYTKPFPYNKELTLYQIQSFFSFVSSKNSKEQFDFYKNYFEKNKWQIIDLREDSETKRITAIKEKQPDKLTIIIGPNPQDKNTTIVSISNIHIGLYSKLNSSSTSTK
jgi:hypothetical protein